MSTSSARKLPDRTMPRPIIVPQYTPAELLVVAGPTSHDELAVRVVALEHARRAGDDVEQELSAIINAWERNR